MKYLRTISLLFFLCSVNFYQYAQYNPMTDFQVPYSVSEQIHAMLCSVEHMLQDTTIKNVDCVALVNNRLLDLEQVSQKISSTHSFHAIYRDDRQTLQALIDRIDALLAILQDDESDGSDEQVQKSVQDSRALLKMLQSKILV